MARIQVSHLTFAYEGSPDLIFDDASFQVDTDWKLGFIGRNGRGKTTLLRILAGELPSHGAVSTPVPCDYFPFPIRDSGKTPLDVAADLDPEGQVWRFMKEISCLDVSDDILNRPFATLSGGEQAKVLLAALFSRENHFLLIDEPTNHLDMMGRQVVSRYLNGKKGFILVSHDRAFLDGCVDHVLSINRANIEVQKGNFSTWEENKRRQDEFEINQNAKLKKEISSLQSAARQANAWADKVESSKMGASPGAHERPKNARSYMGEQSRRMQQRRKNLENRVERNIEEKEGLLKNLELADDLKIFPLTHPAGRLIQCRDAAIAYGDRTIIEHLTFTLENGDILALVGKNGPGKQSEGDVKTPLGTWTIGEAYGIKEDPGSLVPFTQITDDMYWCATGSNGRNYNTLLYKSEHPDWDYSEDEHLMDYPIRYAYLLDLGYNAPGAPYAGNAIFLHCWKEPDYPTGGCVAVSEESMVRILQTVTPGTAVTIY